MPDNTTTEQNDHRDNGDVIDIDGQRVLRFIRHLDAARDEVWDAITDRDRLARWAFRGTLEPRAGGSVHFEFGDDEGGRGTVITWNEPSLLEYEWTGGDMHWHIRFALADGNSGGTVLTFDHLLPDASQPEFAAGWHWHLDRLVTLLGGGEPADVAEDEHFHELLVHYRGD